VQLPFLVRKAAFLGVADRVSDSEDIEVKPAADTAGVAGAPSHDHQIPRDDDGAFEVLRGLLTPRVVSNPVDARREVREHERSNTCLLRNAPSDSGPPLCQE
jgi:hypothetical protein